MDPTPAHKKLQNSHRLRGENMRGTQIPMTPLSVVTLPCEPMSSHLTQVVNKPIFYGDLEKVFAPWFHFRECPGMSWSPKDAQKLAEWLRGC